MQPLEQSQGPDQGQVRREQLGEAARQRLEARIAGDHERQDGEGRGLGRLLRQLRLAGQRLARRLLGAGAQGELRPRPQRRHTPGPAVCVREVAIGRDGEIVAAGLLLAAADDQRSERVVGREQLARPRDDDSGVIPLGRGERGRQAEPDVCVSGLLLRAGDQRGDVGGADGGRAGGAGTAPGHSQEQQHPPPDAIGTTTVQLWGPARKK